MRNRDDEATAKAEVKIARVLKALIRETGRKVAAVSVDVQNYETPDVEIYLRDDAA